jgi:hypothetical protein
MALLNLLRTRISLVDDAGEMDWPRLLILFFRVVAVLQMLKGVVHWCILLYSGSQELAVGDVEYLSADVYFAVLDPISAVGLWMTSSWGSVLWLLAALSQIVVCLGFAEVHAFMWLFLLVDVIAIAMYIYINWQVGKVTDE